MLQEALATPWQVVLYMRGMQCQCLEIKNVDVGFVTLCQLAPVQQGIQLCGLPAQHMDGIRQFDVTVIFHPLG